MKILEKTLSMIALFLIISTNLFAQTKQKNISSIENQYCADLGNGKFLNPILRGNYADPSVLRDGDDYYMTHSSFDNIPGLLIWHSKDLVNWEPIGHALSEYVGDVWAPDFIKHKGLFYIYFPAGGSNWVVTASDPSGPWSKPIDLKVGGIDPGHVATPEGKRYLHLAGGNMVSLSEDGLKVTGPMKKVYKGWEFPKDWIVECSCLESPKFTYKNGFYYMTAAEGGTAGPPTSHMVISARSKTPFGPWENSPNNPIVRNTDRNNKWASIGHGTLVDSPDGKWWIVFHGFEKENRAIGRQTLLLPIVWTGDGWFKVPEGADPAKPLKKPMGEIVPHGMKLSDDFSEDTLGSQWNVLKNENRDHFLVNDGKLSIEGIGKSISETQPLTIMPANDSYQVSVKVSAGSGNSKGGLVLYYNSKYYVGLEFSEHAIFKIYNNGERGRLISDINQDSIYLRLKDDHNDLLCYYSLDGKDWKRMDFVTEISGYNHNILGGWGYLKPGLFAVGDGKVDFSHFDYLGLD